MFCFGMPIIRHASSSSAPSNPRQPLAGHLRIVGALVVVRVDEDLDVVVPFRQQRQRSGATERIVIRMRREQQDRLLLDAFELERLPKAADSASARRRRISCLEILRFCDRSGQPFVSDYRRMPLKFTTSYLEDSIAVLRYYKKLSECALWSRCLTTTCKRRSIRK